MARTHGTRSAYNAGCRCDACREASRLARARQRNAAQDFDNYGDGTEDAMPEGWLILLGLVLFTAGLVTLWQASPPGEDDESATGPDRTRRRWIVGGVLAAAGIASFVIAERK